MGKRISVFITVLFLVLVCMGCGKSSIKEPEETLPKNNEAPLESVQADSSRYMKKPGISVSNIHKYGDWGVTQVMGESVKIAGQYFFVELMFEKPLSIENARKNITFTGCDISQLAFNEASGEQDRVVHILCLDGVPGNTYTLNISKDLKDTSNSMMKEDIKLNITVVEDAVAHYTLAGEDGSYDLEAFMEGITWVSLTTNPKTFIVDFTKDVDKKSVEDSISRDISFQNVKCSFKWPSNRRLQLDLNGLMAVKEYKINVGNAKDSEGFKIIGDFLFTTNKPNTIGYIDIGTKKSSIIREMKDRLYMPYENSFIGRYIVLDDLSSRTVYDIKENRQAGEFDGGRFWLNDVTSLSYNYETKAITLHSIVDNSQKQILKLSSIPENKMLRTLRISPDGKKIALFVAVNDHGLGGPGDLYIFSTDGKLLHEYKNIVAMRFVMAGEIEDMAWLDDKSIVVEDTPDTNNNFITNIVKINIDTGKKEIYVKSGRNPVTLPGKDLIVVGKCSDDYKNTDGYAVFSEGREVGLLKGKTVKYPNGCSYENFMFLDESNLIFNRNDEIVLYNINGKTEELIGSGKIFGMSADHTRVYFMGNYQNLYNYD